MSSPVSGSMRWTWRNCTISFAVNEVITHEGLGLGGAVVVAMYRGCATSTLFVRYV